MAKDKAKCFRCRQCSRSHRVVGSNGIQRCLWCGGEVGGVSIAPPTQRQWEESLRWLAARADPSKRHECHVEEVVQSKRAKRRTRKKNRPRTLRPDEYHAYISSPAWKQKRKQALSHHGSKCQVCGATEKLQVHHKHYRRLGRERMADLSILCGGCHENEHESEKIGVYDPMTAAFLDLDL